LGEVRQKGREGGERGESKRKTDRKHVKGNMRTILSSEI
jgi:hypothetical protein